LVCTFRKSEGKPGTKSDDAAAMSTKLVMSQQHKDVARDYKKIFTHNQEKDAMLLLSKRNFWQNIQASILSSRWLKLMML